MLQDRTLGTSLFLFCTLLGVYLLAYASHPASADGKAMLATAVTLVQHGSPDIMLEGATNGLLPEPARMGSFGTDSLWQSKKGITPSLLLIPLVLLAELLPWVTVRAATMLFNPLVTALTVVVLYWLGRRLHYRHWTALIVALLFGLATFALAYVKTLFAESLAGLLLLVALAAAYAYHERSTSGALWVAGVALGLAAGVKLPYAAMPAIIGLYLFGWQPLHWPLRDLLRFVVPVVVALLLLAVYNMLRFGSPLESGFNFSGGETFDRPFFAGAVGMLFTPYKGLFWYNPVLLLALPGWELLRRRTPRLAWTLLALVAAQIATYASWWTWHGGLAWGPRFLLPVTPMIALCLAPVVGFALDRRNVWLHVALVLLAALSIALQLPGTLYDLVPHNGYLLREYGDGSPDTVVSGLDDAVLTDIEASPLAGHLVMAAAGWDSDLAWLDGTPDGLHLLAALLLVAAGVAILSPRISRRGSVILAVLALVVSLNIVLVRQQRGPDYARVQAFEDAIQPPDATLAATTLFGSSLLDVENGARVMTVNAPTTPDDPLAAGIWDYALAHNDRLWFVSWFPPGHPDNWQERALWAQYPAIQQRTFDGHRAVYFDLGPAPEPAQPGGWQFGPLRLAAYGLEVSGGCVRFTAAWETSDAIERDFTWFVHLIDAGGAIVAQQDRAPAGGYHPTSTWRPGEPVRDRLCLPLPDDADITGWHLRVGFVDPATGERLPARLPDGTPAPDGFVLLPAG